MLYVLIEPGDEVVNFVWVAESMTSLLARVAKGYQAFIDGFETQTLRADAEVAYGAERDALLKMLAAEKWLIGRHRLEPIDPIYVEWTLLVYGDLDDPAIAKGW